MTHDVVRPRLLQAGDRVRIVSPASTPSAEGVAVGVELLSSWGLEVEVAPHVFDEFAGFLAGTDDDRLADLNDAFRDPSVRAVFASRGGKGAYRIVDRLDFDAIAADPKLLIGFSEITILHLAILHRTGVAGIHGPFANWSFDFCNESSAAKLRQAVLTTGTIRVASDPTQATSVGDFGPIDQRPGRWTAIDVLKDQLNRLGVPILGGLPLGHGLHPSTIPIGTTAVMDADAGALTVESATSS